MKIWQKFDFFSNFSFRWRSIARIAGFSFLAIYFIFQAFTGDNGFRSYLIIKKEIAECQNTFDKLQKEFELLSRKVSLLSNKSLDLDILEERCRAILNYCYPDDVVIRTKTMNTHS